MTTRQVDEYNQ